MDQILVTTISEVCSATAGHSFRRKPEHTPSGNVRVVQPKDITRDGMLNSDDLCRIVHTPKKLLCNGDVLLINRGRFTAAVFDETLNAPCVATSAFMILTPNNPEQLLPDYLALYLNSKEGKAQFKRLTEQSTIPFISRANLESIRIPLPSLARQKTLATFGKLNKTYSNLSARKLELQTRILDHALSL